MKLRLASGRGEILALAGIALGVVLASAPAHAQCVGDCNNDGMVLVNELVLGVNIALGSQPVGACPAFANGQGEVNVAQLVKGVNNALNGCPATPTATVPGEHTATATATGTEVVPTATLTATGAPTGTATATATIAVTPPTATATTEASPPTPTATPNNPCPLAAGAYTVTQASGGVLKVYSFAPFPFPAGGQIVQDVGPGDANCVHDVVVPFPGGFSAPNFCVPALGFTTSVTQTACGIGSIDSNGGSDFDTSEDADTSDASGTCNLPQAGGACAFSADASIRVDITVGDGTPDTCASGTANALVTVPVHTLSWSDNSGGSFGDCPGNGVFDEGVDARQAEFNQILDFTTASAKGRWTDLDGNGCSLAGLGPAGGHTGNGICTGPGAPAPCCTGQGSGTCPTAPTGTCIDINTKTVTTIAQGQFGSTTAGVGDGSFATYLPNTITGPAAPLGATCASPPAINFSGKATRCLP